MCEISLCYSRRVITHTQIQRKRDLRLGLVHPLQFQINFVVRLRCP